MPEIIAAIIGAIGALLITKFDDIISYVRKSGRKINGEWEGDSFCIERLPKSIEDLKLLKKVLLNFS